MSDCVRVGVVSSCFHAHVEASLNSVLTWCRSDLIPVILILVLGITNGHLASLASMHMPSLLPHNYRYTIPMSTSHHPHHWE